MMRTWFGLILKIMVRFPIVRRLGVSDLAGAYGES